MPSLYTGEVTSFALVRLGTVTRGVAKVRVFYVPSRVLAVLWVVFNEKKKKKKYGTMSEK